MRFNKFSLILGHLKGAPVIIHWTVIPISFLFSGFKFDPVYYLTFFLLILIHEVGHAIVVKFYSFELREITVHGFGGVCVWSGNATKYQNCFIAWGGIIAQVVVFILFVSSSYVYKFNHSIYLEQVARVLLGVNLFLIFLNLLPFEPFDGAQAWAILDPIWKDLKSLKNKNKTDRSKNNKKVKRQVAQIIELNSRLPSKRLEKDTKSSPVDK